MAIDWHVSHNQDAALAVIAMANAAAFWNANLPSIYEVPAKLGTDIDMHDLRIGVIKTLSEGALLGVGATLITQSWWPIAGVVAYIGLSYLFLAYTINSTSGQTEVGEHVGYSA